METTVIDTKNTEIAFGATTDLTWWNIGFHWWYILTSEGNRNLTLSINILCFRFWIEIWRWKR